MDRLRGYESEYGRKLPLPDLEKSTVIKERIIVQVVQITDITTSLLSQIHRLEAKRDSVEKLPDEKPDDSEPRPSQFHKFIVRDSGNRLLYLIYHTAPAILPKLGQYLLLRNIELRRGLLVAMPETALVLPNSGEISTQDQLESLKALLKDSTGSEYRASYTPRT